MKLDLRKILKSIGEFRWEILSGLLAQGIIFYIVILLVIAFLVFPKQEARFLPGQVSRKDYVAPHDIIFVNSVRTNEERRKAQEKVRPIFKAAPELNEEYISMMEEFRKFIDTIPPDGVLNTPELFKALAGKNFWSKLGAAGFTENDLRIIISLDSVGRNIFFKSLTDTQSMILKTSITEEQLAMQQTQAKNMLRLKGGKAGTIETAEKILLAFIGPNSGIDEVTTRKIKDAAALRVMDITEKIFKEQIFLRKGEVINERHVDILNTLYGTETKKEALARYKKLIIMSLFALAGILIFWYFMERLSINPLKDPRLFRLFLVQTLITIFLGIGAVKFIPVEGLQYFLLLPLVTNAWIITYFISVEASLLSTLFLGAFFALSFSLDRAFLLSSMITGAVSSFLIKHDCRNSEILRGGLLTILIGSLTIISVNLLLDEPLKTISEFLLYNLAAIVFALFAMVVLVMVYVRVFNIITRYHLSDLSDINHPLIRQLQRNAPGSYHHSLMTGDLAEIAADSIGANGFLARVACLYHDIGKAKMPHFFIENQRGLENPHDSYPPSLSKLVVISHVKDGIQMAKKARLPKEIIDAISQHHGTTMMAYFFNKALAQSDGNPIDEFSYRYEGPKPQYPEMAVIALSDAAESAVRALDEPTPHRVEATVNAIFMQRLLDGQYNECGLSISQLEKVKDVIIDTLVGIYHSRIEYPDVHELKSRLEKRARESEEQEIQNKKVEAGKKKEPGTEPPKTDESHGGSDNG